MADENLPPYASIQLYDILFNIIGFQLICFVGFFGNIFVLFVISKNKSLQTPCFLLIAGECFCSIVIAAGFFVNGVEEAAMLSGNMEKNRTRIYCYLSTAFMPAWGIQASSLIASVVSLDRLVSILDPMKYRLLGKRYAYTCLAFCFTYATMATIGGLIDNELVGPMDTIPCVIYFSAFTPGFFGYYGGFNLAFCILCVLLYGIMLITFEWRRRKMKLGVSNDTSNSAFMKQQMACMPMVKWLMTAYVVSAVLPEITVAIASASTVCKPYMPRMYYYGSVVKASMCLTEILALGLGSSLFRQCLRNMF